MNDTLCFTGSETARKALFPRRAARFLISLTDDLSAHWNTGGILRAAVDRPATARGRPRGVSVQSLILLDIRTVVCAALLIAPQEVVLAQGAAVGGSSLAAAAPPLAIGCVATPPNLALVNLNAPPRALRERPPETVEVFAARGPTRPFVEVSLIEARRDEALARIDLDELLGPEPLVPPTSPESQP